MNRSESLTVALLAGGRSSEHEISLTSAQAVREGLIEAGHEVLSITIDRKGLWVYEEQPLSVRPGKGLLGADVAFPVLHGPFGEDGTVQGALEIFDIAYVGADVAASALCMDKVMFKDLMSSKSVPQVDYVGVREEYWRSAKEDTLKSLAVLGLPVFVKPARLGSSVGIVKVAQATALPAALDEAFKHDALAVVEAMAHGLEVECAVLGLSDSRMDLSLGVAMASEPGQISFQSDWYDFQAKYQPGAMELLVPAQISSEARERVRELAVEVFGVSGCEGLARVDFFVDGERVLVNELNTMPGFTPTSVYAKLMSASGIGYPELVDRLCRLALERHRKRASYEY